MIESLEKIMALIVSLENDSNFDIALEVEYEIEEDMFYISHNVIDNDFDTDTTLRLNKKLIEYLDSNGIYNYGFGYSYLLFGEEDRVNKKFPKKMRHDKFKENSFSMSINPSKVKQLSLVA